jgi:hypothetical protein
MRACTHTQKLVTALCLAPTEAVFQSLLLLKVDKVVITFTMNPQNAWRMEATMLPSPLPMRQLFSAGAPSVESRTNPTGAAETQQQRVSTEHNNNVCTIIKLATYNIRDGHNSNLEAALRACEQM